MNFCRFILRFLSPLLRGKGVGELFQGHSALYGSDPIYFFGIFIFRSPSGKTTGFFGSGGKSFWDTAADCSGNPDQIFGLLILLVSFFERNLPARNALFIFIGFTSSPGSSSLWFYYSIFVAHCQGVFLQK